MKENNLRLVLETVRSRRQISRRELARVTNLTAATVTNLVKELLEEGYLLETGKGESHSGPRPIFLELNPLWGYIVGVELTVTDIICVLTDFKAQVLFRAQLPVENIADKDGTLDALILAVEDAIRRTGVPRDKVRGVGIVSAGPFNHNEGVMLAPPNFPGWGRTPIRQIVEDRLGIPVRFDKETQAAAFGEYWFGEAALSHVLSVCNILSIGIGGSLLLDGKAYRGHLENACNIGHTKAVLEGERCTCGERGCLETVADGRAAVRAVRQRFRVHPEEFASCGVSTEADIDFFFVVRQAEAGMPACREAVVDCARYMGMALANVIRTVAPDTLVLCGEFPDNSPLFVRACIENIRCRYNPAQERVNIYHSALGPEIGALGGVAIVLGNL